MPPTLTELQTSHLPALQLSVALGYQYLSPAEALALRGGRESVVLLEGVLRQWIKDNNAVYHGGKQHQLSDDSVSSAVRKLRDINASQGLVEQCKEVFELLTLGTSEPVIIEGSKKSPSVQYINWVDPSKNVYHVTEEYAVQRYQMRNTYRPDVVLCVNGIPLVVMECKSPHVNDAMGEAISQHLRNCAADGIRSLYRYAALSLALTMQDARYGCGTTKAEFYAVWREQYTALEQDQLTALVSRKWSAAEAHSLATQHSNATLAQFNITVYEERQVTAQDKLLYSLCRPERLLDFVRYFTLFEHHERKAARYQQYFVVKRTLDKVSAISPETGKRSGGVIWHTQGSGKSLTMVMLTRLLALLPGLKDSKILVVTDRTDLDDQIKGTLKNCDVASVRAHSGKHLAQLLKSAGREVITTLVHKFNQVCEQEQVYPSADIFILIDEAHRTQYGNLAGAMDEVFPNACKIAFTGTPLFKSEKHTAKTFGGIIDPVYSIRDAVADKAVVPLMYEARHVKQQIVGQPLDYFAEKAATPYTPYEVKRVQQSFENISTIIRSEGFVEACVHDIIDHFTANITPGFKGQLVAPDKETAVKYWRKFGELKSIMADLVISAPDNRVGHEDAFLADPPPVQAFYKGMMDKYNKDHALYEKTLIDQFKHSEESRIIIVVDKLLTGFDVPRNQVLYLARQLKEHTLLQAIARVNRLCAGKEYGYIVDYVGNLTNLADAFTIYDDLIKAGFEQDDLEGTLTDLYQEAEKVVQAHDVLRGLFKTLKNSQDLEAYSSHLYDKAIRHDFYTKLSTFARLLKLALSSKRWCEAVGIEGQAFYKKEVAFYLKLREAVKIRYGDSTDFKEFEKQIRALVDKYVVPTGEVLRLTSEVNIFDEEAFRSTVDSMQSAAAKADFIASQTSKKLTIIKDADPAFAQKLSEQLQKVIEAFHQKRLTELEFLNQVRDIQQQVADGGHEQLPEPVRSGMPKAIYHQLQGFESDDWKAITTDQRVELSTQLDAVIRSVVYRDGTPIVDWPQNKDFVKQLDQAVADALYDFQDQVMPALSAEDMDSILKQAIDVAKSVYAG